MSDSYTEHDCGSGEEPGGLFDDFGCVLGKDCLMPGLHFPGECCSVEMMMDPREAEGMKRLRDVWWDEKRSSLFVFGDPDEEGGHNCDEMGCGSCGPHLIARLLVSSKNEKYMKNAEVADAVSDDR